MKVNHAAAIPTTSFDSPGRTSAPAKGQISQFNEDPKVGDFAKAFDAADVKITAELDRLVDLPRSGAPPIYGAATDERIRKALDRPPPKSFAR